jgi:peptidoglycan/xylan/chitin deacetylase (PgdA/CDA1 family)
MALSLGRVFGDVTTNAAPVSAGTNSAPAVPLPPAPSARVAQYQGDRAAAISYTFDDGTHDQLQVVPLLNAHGFHGTFLIIASRVPDTEAQVAAQHLVSWGSISWEKLRELQAEGHEMSSHSWSHPQLGSLDEAGVRAEVEKADQLMAEKLGKPPLTFCYPYNGFNDKIRAIVLEHHVNDRTVCVGLAGPTFTQDFANEWVDELIHDHGWGVTMIHNVNNTDPNATNLTVLNGEMDYVKSRSDAVWVDTFLDVSLYTKEQAAAKLAVTSTGDHQADVSLTCPLDPTLYHFPLTVVVSLPGVTQASAGQGSSTVPVIVGKDSAQFDVVPGPETTKLTWIGGK